MLVPKSIYHKNHYDIELRPQITLFPGSIEAEIPNYFAPYFGLNQRFGNQKIWLVLNSSMGIGFTWGAGAYAPKFISGITLGPKFRTNFVTLGAGYTYFLSEPEYVYIGSYPHTFSLTLEFEI